MAPPLSDLERLTIRAALEDLNTAFCHHLDHDDVDALLELFTDDVHYTHGARVSRGTSVCMTFGAYGEPPLSPAIPTLVADFVDRYVCGDDGKWRFKERHIHRIFVAPDNPGPIGQKK